MAYSRKGFWPVQNLTGKNAILQQYRVSAAADKAYFIGDPVRIKSNGRVTNFATSTSSGGADLLGVVQGVFKDPGNNTDPLKPLTFNQPTNGNFLTTSTEGWVTVNVDKDQVYVAQIDVSISAGLIGSTVKVSAGAPNTKVGRSGYTLGGATIGTTSDGQFKIVGIYDNDLTGRGDKASGNAVKVILNGSLFTTTTGI